MGVEGQDKIIEKDGEKKDCFQIDFTNGALQQLKELKDFFHIENETNTIKVAISFLQKMKEEREKK